MKPTDDMILKVVEMAKQDIEGGGEPMPMFHIGNGKEMNIVAAPFGPNVSDKDFAALAVKTMAKKMNAEFVIFACESWSIKDQEAARDFQNNRHKYASVSEHPKAIDVMMFQLETLDKCYMGMAEVTGKKKKRKMGSVEWREFNREDMEGRMTNFLSVPPKSFTDSLKKL